MNEEKEKTALLSIKEVAQLLNFKPVTIYRMISAGKIAAVRTGTKKTILRVERAELEAYIKRNKG